MTCDICWEDEKASCTRLDHATATRNRLALRGRLWSRLVRHTESGGRCSGVNAIELIYGDRHYLDGRPIHCGDALELQHFEFREDDFGQFTVYLNKGTVVRYEVEHRWDKERNTTVRVPVMYVGVGGYSFKAPIDHGCGFRWPERND